MARGSPGHPRHPFLAPGRLAQVGPRPAGARLAARLGERPGPRRSAAGSRGSVASPATFCRPRWSPRAGMRQNRAAMEREASPRVVPAGIRGSRPTVSTGQRLPEAGARHSLRPRSRPTDRGGAGPRRAGPPRVPAPGPSFRREGTGILGSRGGRAGAVDPPERAVELHALERVGQAVVVADARPRSAGEQRRHRARTGRR